MRCVIGIKLVGTICAAAVIFVYVAIGTVAGYPLRVV